MAHPHPNENVGNGTDQRPLPLAGVKVVELGTLIAGPYATSLLAQFGAEVIKIESPAGGAPLRTWRKLHKGTSYWWYSQSRNKKSVTLNLKSPRAQQIVRDLVRDADIVIENFRPGSFEALGLGWEVLSAINPKLVTVLVSGYGQTGPYKDRPGFAAIAESMGGLRYLAGYPDRPPVRVGVNSTPRSPRGRRSAISTRCSTCSKQPTCRADGSPPRPTSTKTRITQRARWSAASSCPTAEKIEALRREGIV